MAFFGFENTDLEEEKRRFLAGNVRQDEDIAVYNWGEEDYDGLGNALQEGGDELNDETFGTSGPVGECRCWRACQCLTSRRQGLRFHCARPRGSREEKVYIRRERFHPSQGR